MKNLIVIFVGMLMVAFPAFSDIALIVVGIGVP